MKGLVLLTVALMWLNGFAFGAALVGDIPIIMGLSLLSSVLLVFTIYSVLDNADIV